VWKLTVPTNLLKGGLIELKFEAGFVLNESCETNELNSSTSIEAFENKYHIKCVQVG